MAGVAGGRRIAVPARGTRPTTDRVREALFNVLAARVDFTGVRVLDLYAGSGALGLEALSRGAASVLFVERDGRAAQVITRNIAAVGLPGARVRQACVASVVAAGAPEPVDMVLADPPYDVTSNEVEAVVADLVRYGWVGAHTVMVVERPVAAAVLIWPSGWTVWPVRRYGDTRLEAAQWAASC